MITQEVILVVVCHQYNINIGYDSTLNTGSDHHDDHPGRHYGNDYPNEQSGSTSGVLVSSNFAKHLGMFQLKLQHLEVK